MKFASVFLSQVLQNILTHFILQYVLNMEHYLVTITAFYLNNLLQYAANVMQSEVFF